MTASLSVDYFHFQSSLLGGFAVAPTQKQCPKAVSKTGNGQLTKVLHN